jgi:branched-chain amino acid transport system permease protein
VVLGVRENLTAAYLTTQCKSSLAFLVMIVVLLVRPEGLLGREFKERV